MTRLLERTFVLSVALALIAGLVPAAAIARPVKATAPVPLADTAPADAYEPADGHQSGPVDWANLRDLQSYLPRSGGQPVWGAEPYTEQHTIDTATDLLYDVDWFKLTVPQADYDAYPELSYRIDAFSQDPAVDTYVEVYYGVNQPSFTIPTNLDGVADTAYAVHNNRSTPWQPFNFGSFSSVFIAPHVNTKGAGTYWIRVRPFHDGGTGFAGRAGAYTLRVKVGLGLRLAGPSRIDTAVRISQEGWKTRPLASADMTVVVAYGYDYPDALAASGLAGTCNGPILLCPGTTLPTSVRDEIVRVGAKGVYVIGGPTRITDGVMDQIEAISPSIRVERVAGPTRIQTAVEIAKKMRLLGSGFKTVLVASGYNYPDALALAPMAAFNSVPILLTHPAGLDADVRAALAANGITDVVIAGSTEALAGQESDITDHVGIPADRIYRVGGANRYETAKMIGSWACDRSGPGARSDGSVGTPGDTMALLTLSQATFNGYASGQNYPDALAAGAFVGRAGAPLLLTPTAATPPSLFGLHGSLPPGSTTWWNDVGAPIVTSYVFGGTPALSTDCFKEIDAHTMILTP